MAIEAKKLTFFVPHIEKVFIEISAVMRRVEQCIRCINFDLQTSPSALEKEDQMLICELISLCIC